VKIYNFDAASGEKIDKFGSDFIFSKIVHADKDVRISCFYLRSSGLVGYHQAVTPQLFLVVQGEGWTRGQIDQRIPVSANQAVFWEKGEWHETGTDTVMTAIVIEGESLNLFGSLNGMSQRKQ